MKPLLAFLLLASALTIGAQTANVIELTPADQARAQKAWDALQKAKNDWGVLQTEIQMKYAEAPQSCIGGTAIIINGGCGGTQVMTSLPGFENGFEFSKDFRFIVPKVLEPTSSTGRINVPSWHCNLQGTTCY
jgi:hypothetical protein